MKKISIGVCCYNEIDNVYLMYEKLTEVMKANRQYDYEIVFADNNSSDGTQDALKSIAKKDKKVKVILNQANFGIQRSGANLMSKVSGDAYIGIPCDFQEPPELIPKFIEEWEKGYDIVWGQKTKSKESTIKYFLRKCYYKIIKLMSKEKQYEQVTGFGIQSIKVVQQWLALQDPTISLRHVIGEWGYSIKLIPYTQEKRRSGKSSFKISTYLTFAINSAVNTSYLPLRMVTVTGVISSAICFIIGLVYLIYKILYWKTFSAGVAPQLIGLFFLGSIQLFGIGILGEYIGVILRRITKKPNVIEKDLINFNYDNEKEINNDEKI